MITENLFGAFRGLYKEFGDIFAGLRPGPATRTLTVAKPFCAPARNIITGALEPYGVKILKYSENPISLDPRGALRKMKVELRTWENLKYGPLALAFFPLASVAKVTVPEKQAAWAEYLLLRTGKLYVPGAYVNKRNEQWAAKHGGAMPPAWQDGKPWIERSCSEGMAAWQPRWDAAKNHKKR